MCYIVWGIDISFEKLTPEIGGWLWKEPFAHNASRAVDFMQSLSFLNISSGDLLFLVVTYLSIGYSDSWRR